MVPSLFNHRRLVVRVVLAEPAHRRPPSVDPRPSTPVRFRRPPADSVSCLLPMGVARAGRWWTSSGRWPSLPSW